MAWIIEKIVLIYYSIAHYALKIFSLFKTGIR